MQRRADMQNMARYVGQYDEQLLRQRQIEQQASSLVEPHSSSHEEHSYVLSSYVARVQHAGVLVAPHAAARAAQAPPQAAAPLRRRPRRRCRCRSTWTTCAITST